jgi:hypothetical protein
MYKGLDALAEYLEECRAARRDLVRSEVRSIMETFRVVLWQHLDDEVAELGAENMRKYWTLSEMQRMPF